MTDPQAALERVYDRFGLTMDEGFRTRLGLSLATAREYRSGHQYSLEEFGLSRSWVYQKMPEVFASHGFDR